MSFSEGETKQQQHIFQELGDHGLHPQVKRIDTHASTLFLEGDRVLKIKRAVRYPFLDYSTLEKRKAACEEEIRINRVYAPQVYRRVTPITQNANGSIEIDGSGKPVEYAVEMNRFDESQTIDNLAAQGPLSPGIAASIADAIAASHTIAPVVAMTNWVETISQIIEDNNVAFQKLPGVSKSEIETLRSVSISALQSLRPLLEHRQSLGCVLRCHGDLHLGNIVLIDGKPTLFDAIEFDPSIASVDVLYDLAFPIMDFIQYGRFAEANIVLNRYLRATSQIHLDALSTLPLFISLRAAIRAKVLYAKGQFDASIKQAASQYLALACRSIKPPPAKLVSIGGLSGTGKSVLAQNLAPKILPYPGAILLRTDVLRKELFGVGDFDRLPEEAYRPEISEQTYAILADRAVRILRQGHSVVVDGVFAKAEERMMIRRISQDSKVEFTGYFLDTDLETRIKRISHRTNDASDATPQVAVAQEKYVAGAMDWQRIDASGTPEQTLAKCALSKHYN